MQEILDYVMYHLKQIGLDKRLYGGIILTGGGAQLKHIIQLTEYVTGMGARIGSPNEHLAGGHSDVLMNPAYSTCIGLILRGYHDYESGKVQLVGESGNTIVVNMDEPEMSETVDEQELAEDDNEVNKQRTEKRTENFKKLFDRLKGKFIELFEDVDDKEIE